MNLPRLANTLGQLQKLIRETEATAAEVLTVLSEIKSHKDPFARHVFQARYDYRSANLRAGKSDKRVRRCVWMTYTKARDLGFRGSEADWLQILRPTAPEEPIPAVPASAAGVMAD